MGTRLAMEPLGELEATVMGVVWKAFPATAREVCSRLTGRKKRAYTTIMTTLDRLHRKGLLHLHKDGLAWRYVPVMSKEAFEKALADRLAAEILASHGDRALAAFVDATADVDDALLDRLAEMIAAKRRGSR